MRSFSRGSALFSYVSFYSHDVLRPGWQHYPEGCICLHHQHGRHGKNIAHLTNGSNALHFFYDAQNRPAIVVYNGTAYGYVHNLQGDIIAIVDSAGTKVVEYKYDAWGKPLSETGSMASTLGKWNPFRYRGYVYDEEMGLYYLRSRYYDSTMNRFINADSILADSNLFAYCFGQPINASDPNGHESGSSILRPAWKIGDNLVTKEQYDTFHRFWNEVSNQVEYQFDPIAITNATSRNQITFGITSVEYTKESVYYPYVSEAIIDFINQDAMEFAGSIAHCIGYGVAAIAQYYGMSTNPESVAEMAESIVDKSLALISGGIEMIEAVTGSEIIPTSNHYHTRHVLTIERGGVPHMVERFIFEKCNPGVCNIVLTQIRSPR